MDYSAGSTPPRAWHEENGRAGEKIIHYRAREAEGFSFVFAVNALLGARFLWRAIARRSAAI